VGFILKVLHAKPCVFGSVGYGENKAYHSGVKRDRGSKYKLTNGSTAECKPLTRFIYESYLAFYTIDGEH